MPCAATLSVLGLVAALIPIGHCLAAEPLRLSDPASGGVLDVAVSPDGSTVATATARCDLQLWRVADGQRTSVLRAEAAPTSVAFSADGTRLLAAYSDGSVRLWDVRSGSVVGRFMAHPRATRAAALSPDGRTIAGGGGDGSIHLVDVESGARVRSFAPSPDPRLLAEGVTPRVHALAFSPDGGVLVSGHEGFTGAYAWDPRTGRQLAALAPGGTEVIGVAFSRDGATLATAPEAGQVITLWETATWRARRKLDCRGAAEILGGFSADGRRLWTATANEVWCWDLSSGRRLRSLVGHRDDVTAVTPMPRGAGAVSAGDDGTAVVWSGPGVAPAAPRAPGDDVRLEGPWGAMAAEDPATAYEAMWTMVGVPDRAVPYLRNRLPRPGSVDPERVRALLAQLDDERFTARERAAKELASFHEAAEPLLREHLASTKSPEVAQRLEVLLDSLRPADPDAETLRALRSLEVLERIATPEARAALEEVAAGGFGANLKARAQATLHRLAGQ